MIMAIVPRALYLLVCMVTVLLSVKFVFTGLYADKCS